MNQNSSGVALTIQQQAILVTPPSALNSKTNYNEHKNESETFEDRHLSRQNKSTFTRVIFFRLPQSMKFKMKFLAG